LLPGIKSGGEASAGIYVRGGGPDQNLVLLDGIPVYNPNHLLGFFSIFNGEAIRSVEAIKGGMPAEYGGRLSSVISIDTRDGNKDSVKGSGGIGLISSRLSLETPVVKGRSSLIVTGRRTYIDQVGKLVAKNKIGDNGYYFYDVNAKLDYLLNSKNQLLFTFYTGKDDFTFADIDNVETGYQ
jgi:outer membrane cobalamin receptor